MTQSPQPPTPPTSPRFEADAIGADDRRRDLEHLKILAILHYIMGGLTALSGCAGLIYVVIGIVFAANPQGFNGGSGTNQADPAVIGTAFIAFGGCFAFVIWAMAAATIYAGLCLAKQQRRVFCMIVAGIMCLSIPLGTVLGVFTFIVLARPSVVALFAQRKTQSFMAS